MMHWLFFLGLAYPFLTFPLYCMGQAYNIKTLHYPFYPISLALVWLSSRMLPKFNPSFVILFSLPWLYFTYSLLFIIVSWGIAIGTPPIFPDGTWIMIGMSIILVLAQPAVFSICQKHSANVARQRDNAIATRIRSENSGITITVVDPRVEQINVLGWSAYRFTVIITGVLNTSYWYIFGCHLDGERGDTIRGVSRHTGLRNQYKRYGVFLHIDYNRQNNQWSISGRPDQDSAIYQFSVHPPEPVGYTYVVNNGHQTRGGVLEFDILIPFEDENNTQIRIYKISIAAHQWDMKINSSISAVLYRGSFTLDGSPVTSYEM